MLSAHQIAAKFNKPPPANYVAGMGRGAIGFTTRSDIGPARPITELEVKTGAEGGEGGGGGGEGEFEEEGEGDFDGKSLFANLPYDQEDRDADAVYELIDQKMDEKRKTRREQREEEELKKLRKERPNIHDQFIDLKRNLSSITLEQWAAIPEIGDYNIKSKRQKTEAYIPTPDSLLDAARKERETNAYIDPRTTAITNTQELNSGTTTDLSAIGKGQTNILEHNLDLLSDSVHGQSTVNPRAYMTQLSSLQIATDSDISDYKKARALLKSVRETNPSHAPAWVASARLEEVAGKIVAARLMITKACEACPKSEDVWLEASRLHINENAKTILARAVVQIPESVKIWLRAAQLEETEKGKKRVLRKALEVIPNSVQLWKAAVDLEGPEEAKIMLRRAVECCPTSVELWLGLAKLEPYIEAKRVLNLAQKKIPEDVKIWITAAQLEEANNNGHKCEAIIQKAKESVQQQQRVIGGGGGGWIDRSEWFKHAMDSEKLGFTQTTKAIVRATISINVDDEDKKRTFTDDANSFSSQGYIHAARAVHEVLIENFPNKKSVWLDAIKLEKDNNGNIIELLSRAVKFCPRAEVLWLMWAKETWLAGDVEGSRQILDKAFEVNPDSEQIWLAAVKLEKENKQFERARLLLQKARERAGTDRVWMKSVMLERELNNLTAAKELITSALKIHPNFFKLWLIASQIEEQLGNVNEAREFLILSTKKCPECVACWKCLAELELKTGNISSARSYLETARIKVPQNPELWIAAIRLELFSNNPKLADSLLAKGLQDCPSSGELLALSIEIAPRPQKRARSMDALKRCDDAHVITAVAKLFWMERRLEKARKWFIRATTLNPDLGDAWATFYKFEVQEGDEEKRNYVLGKCKLADPHHGEIWTRIAKSIENTDLPVEQILVKVALGVNSLF